MSVDTTRPATRTRALRNISPVRGASPDLASSDLAGRAVASPALARPAGDRGIRLTRRGRVVVALLVLAAVLAALLSGLVVGSGRASADPSGRPLPVTYRMVLPGETLWSIAGEVAPGQDRRETIARIVELNDMASAGVLAGQRIALPESP